MSRAPIEKATIEAILEQARGAQTDLQDELVDRTANVGFTQRKLKENGRVIDCLQQLINAWPAP